MLYKSFDEFMNVFWKEAHDKLNDYMNNRRDEDWYGQIREARDGILFVVWARILHGQFPAVEIIFNEREERTPETHPDEWNHRAG